MDENLRNFGYFPKLKGKKKNKKTPMDEQNRWTLDG